MHNPDVKFSYDQPTVSKPAWAGQTMLSITLVELVSPKCSNVQYSKCLLVFLLYKKTGLFTQACVKGGWCENWLQGQAWGGKKGKTCVFTHTCHYEGRDPFGGHWLLIRHPEHSICIREEACPTAPDSVLPQRSREREGGRDWEEKREVEPPHPSCDLVV